MKRLPTIALLALASGSAFAQIGVVVNGDRVEFSGAGPQKQGTRVYVPLRGVLEKLGAKVEWQAATRTILATAGDTTISMKLGEFNALVNGEKVTLDAPAMSVSGTTLVPLRFMATALGAEVKWDAPSSTVFINKDGAAGGGADSGSGTPIALNSVTVTPSKTGWIGPEDSIRFQIKGAPGARAFIEAGVLTPQPLELKELESGTYEGIWRPDGKVYSARQRVVGSIRKGNQTRSMQSSSIVTVDTLAIRINTVSPTGRTTNRRPTITITFSDAAGSQIDKTKSKIYWNERDITTPSDVEDNVITYRPDRDQEKREHTIRVVLYDLAGNKSEREFKFTIA